MDAVKTKYKGKFKLIKYHIDELQDVEQFLIKVLLAHNVQADEVDVTIRDESKMIIDLDDLAFLLQKFKGCSHFHMELIVNSGDKIISDELHQEVIDYLEENGEAVIEEFDDTGALSKNTRKFLVNLVFNFLNAKFNNKPSNGDIKAVCIELNKILPCLKFDPSDDENVTLMWDPSKGKGFLYYKFKNKRSDAKVLEPVIANSQDELELSDAEKDELVLFFKTCIVPEQKAALIQKLETTITFRTNLLKDINTNFTEIFPFYFVCPDIILYDFDLRFRTENSLLKLWSHMRSNIVQLGEKTSMEYFHFVDRNLNKFLIVYKYLAPKRKKFENAVKSFIIHDKDPDVNPMKLIVASNSNPYIICIGSNNGNVQYYIDIEKHLLPVPKDFGFLETMDLFYKVHRVFNLNFHTDLKQFLSFFSQCVYGLQDENITLSSRAQELKILLLTQAESDVNSNHEVDLSLVENEFADLSI